jgi:hypothetical protein
MKKEDLEKYCDGQVWLVMMQDLTTVVATISPSGEKLIITRHGTNLVNWQYDRPVAADEVTSVLPYPGVPSFSSRT